MEILEVIKKKTSISDAQRDKIIKSFDRWVFDFEDMGVSDYEYFDDTLRVFVDFGYCMRELEIKQIEILDDDYEPVHGRNALKLRNALEQKLEDFNYMHQNYDRRKKEEQDYREYILFGR